ncbi:hypothetical protein [Actinoplanes sp. N902-109]|uniref:hypothetical protein n=1 Tax=Actinoplanes sp. (strain N902-109) TaxID=649831 RepID=UPI00032940AC|nr:hypothetical protein [Actinoplanes sp. N902-109]AGL16578.1 hypothetical protein L083_3068 [Actinoplanes sp. N902-109]
MSTRTVRAIAALVAGLGATGLAAAPAQAFPVCPDMPVETDATIDDCGQPGGGGGGGGGTAPVYTLQGVINLEKSANEGTWPYRTGGVKVRGYSRLANAGNDRVDADYINVRCTAASPLGYTTTDYDSENNGALVDVTFWSPIIPTSGVPAAIRTITVTCVHHADKNGVAYDTTSSAAYVIPE